MKKLIPLLILLIGCTTLGTPVALMAQGDAPWMFADPDGVPWRAAADWLSDDLSYSAALAWGDVDNDGDLDLAVGNGEKNRAVNRLYLNEGGRLQAQPAWVSDDDSPTNDLAWGDVDGDGALDLVVGNWDGTVKLYRNRDAALSPTADWSSNAQLRTRAVALGDIDGDGDLDLAVGNNEAPNLIYRNNGAGFDSAPIWSGSIGDATESLAWGDVDGDGDLDLAVGNFNEPNYLYRNEGGTLADQPDWIADTAQPTRALAWLDVDQDGDLDLAVANDGAANLIYRNNGGRLATVAWWSSVDAARSQDLVVADVEGDGDLDLVVANRDLGETLYRYEDAGLSPTPLNFQGQNADSVSLALGDVDGDGDLDLAVGDAAQPAALYRHFIFGLATEPKPRQASVRAARAVAWGDVDMDGDLDLAVGGDDGTIFLLQNQGGQLSAEPSSAVQANRPVDGLAWGDVNGDGWLDLAAAQRGAPNQLYLNQGGQLAPTPAWRSADADATRSVVWVDIDGDGDLDLLAGNEGERNRLYINEGVRLSDAASWSSSNEAATFSVAWGDVDGDGDLDLAVGNDGQENELFLNRGGVLDSTPIWRADARDATRALAWGDIDGDGDPDLVVANEGQPNRLYVNQAGTLSTVPNWLSLDADHSESLTLHDVDNDGDLDLTVGNSGETDKIYFNNFGALQSVAGWHSAQRAATRMVRWADVNQDGLPDLAIASLDAGLGLHLSRQPALPPYGNSRLGLHVYGDNSSLGRLAPAEGIAQAGFLGDRSVPLQFEPSSGRSGHDLPIKAAYSLLGGGSWQPAALIEQALGAGGATYDWDLFASGLFGASDLLTLRFEAAADYAPLPWSEPGPFLYPPSSATTYPLRVRGTQIRVVNENGEPVPNATVYRLPTDARMADAPIMSPAGVSRTDADGYLAGRDRIVPGDQLLALAPLSQGDKHTLYYTNGQPTANGLTAFTVAEPGVQTLTVRADAPLLLFDLVVALEWNSAADSQYVAELLHNLYATSGVLYDWTNGQVALGAVKVVQDRAQWESADIKIYATNAMRPYANRGGVVAEEASIDLGNGDVITAQPGEIRIGTQWDRFGGSQHEAHDWVRVLAHELAHYLLFLEDSYLGWDDENQILVALESCTGTAMTDPYDDVNSELRYADAHWEAECGPTLAEKPDWELIRHVYPALLAPPPVNLGPAAMPYRFTRIDVEPTDDEALLPNDRVELVGLDPSFQTARAYLLSSDATIIDLGMPRSQVVKAYGAEVGDELCLFATASFACATLSGNPPEAFVAADLWEPGIALSFVNTRTVDIKIDAVGSDQLAVTLYPAEGAPQDFVLTSGISTRITLATPSVEALLEIRGEQAHQRQIIAYSTGAGPGRARSHDGPGRARSHDGPVAAGNGRVILYPPPDWPKDAFVTLRLAAKVAPPLGLASVEGAFYVSASEGDKSLAGGSILFHFRKATLDDSGVPEPERKLFVHYWDGIEWTQLPTTVNMQTMTASAPLLDDGLYSLMLGDLLPMPNAGWNQFGYSLDYPQPVEDAMAAIAGRYTILYEYDSARSWNDAWAVYAPAVFPSDRTLSELRAGPAYHIYTTEPLTLPLRPMTMETMTPPCAANCPPALVYGELAPAGSLPLNSRVIAYVDGAVCGETTTFDFEGRLVYMLFVDSAADQTGCGALGKRITLTVDGNVIEGTTAWLNHEATRRDMAFIDDASRVDLFLPIVQR